VEEGTGRIAAAYAALSLTESAAEHDWLTKPSAQYIERQILPWGTRAVELRIHVFEGSVGTFAF
jgi:hypothetical protein